MLAVVIRRALRTERRTWDVNEGSEIEKGMWWEIVEWEIRLRSESGGVAAWRVE